LMKHKAWNVAAFIKKRFTLSPGILQLKNAHVLHGKTFVNELIFSFNQVICYPNRNITKLFYKIKGFFEFSRNTFRRRINLSFSSLNRTVVFSPKF